MEGIYSGNTLLCKIKETLASIFCGESAPTRQHLLDFCMAILGLDMCMTVKSAFQRFMCGITKFKLKSYYYMFSNSKIFIDNWFTILVRLMLSMIPNELKDQPIILIVDDTLVEKKGKKFENVKTLFDHTCKNGSNYLDGHCFVTILMCIPVILNRKLEYISSVLTHRMWTGEKTKLEMANELICMASNIIGNEKKIIVLFDSWYPKGIMCKICEKENIGIICNVRHDTTLYNLPPVKTGKRGRPRQYGERLSLDNFSLKEISGTNYKASSRYVKTKIFGNKVVLAIVTENISSKSRRIFICTDENISKYLDVKLLSNDTMKNFYIADKMFLPLCIYSLRWSIETSFYELKTFWSFANYRLRSAVGIERLVNLQSIVYSLMSMLPSMDARFEFLADRSIQERRFLLSRLIQRQIFIDRFVRSLENAKKYPELVEECQRLALEEGLAA